MSGLKRQPNVRHRVATAVHIAADHARLLLLLPLALIVIVGGAYWGWQTVRHRGGQIDTFRLEPQKIELIGTPSWIKADAVRDEIVRNGSLDGSLSILEENLAERIARACAAHPWIEQVQQVEKFHPPRVEVTAIYRQPVGVVVIDNRRLPVDRHSVWLPERDFAPEQLRQLPAIRGQQLRRPAAVGLAWGDDRVAGAATIAAAFGPLWQRLKLAEIVPASRPVRGTRHVYVFELVTRSGLTIPWGRQYLDGNPSEPSAEEKCGRLKVYVDRYGTLDGVSLHAPLSSPAARTAASGDDDAGPQ